MTVLSNRLPFFAVFPIVCLCLVGKTDAQPTLTFASPSGLQAGATTTIRILGSDFGDQPQLMLPRSFDQNLVSVDGQSATFEVSVDPNAFAGIVPLRVTNSKGISNRLLVSIDRCRQTVEPRDLETLPIAWTTRFNGANRPRMKFSAQAGQTIVVDVEAKRLGSNFQPVVRVYDSRESQVASSGPRLALAGDARCQFKVADDGEFSVEVHDLLYRAPANSAFRLKVGEFTPRDQAIPIGTQKGQTYSGKLTSMDPGFAGELIGAVFADAYDGWVEVPTPAMNGVLSPPPRIFVSQSPEVGEVEHQPNQPQQIGTAPLGINGRLAADESFDRFVIDVTAGHRYHCEVFAQRVGSPLDGILVVRGKDNQQLGRNDDRPGTTDPALDFDVPNGTNQIQVDVIDLNRSGGEDYHYRLAIQDLTAGGFSVSLPLDRLAIPPNNTVALELPINRGPVRGPLEIELVPMNHEHQAVLDQWTISGTTIPANSNRGLLTITSTADFDEAVLVKIGCRVKDSAIHAHYATRPADQPSTKLMPWLARDLAVAKTTFNPIEIVATGGEAELGGFNGGEFSIPVTVTRAEGVQSPIRIRLLTTQTMPQKTVKVDNKDQVVDDVDRAIRLKAGVELAANVTEANVEILIPADLPGGEWGFSLVAELLSDDKSQVLSTSATPTRYFRVASAIGLSLTDVPTPLPANAGETVTIKGTINRVEPFANPVTVQLAGLPEGYGGTVVTLAPAQNEFELTLTIPESANGDVGGIQVQASSLADDDSNRKLAQSPNAPITLKVAPKADGQPKG